MSVFVGRDGSISLFRVGTLIAIVGILLVVGGVAAYFLDQNSFRTPLDVDPYPSAQPWGMVNESNVTRRSLYLVSDAQPADVAAYYDQKLRELDRTETGCERIPAAGVIRGSENNPSQVPFWYTCLFQRTGFGVSQQTTITIQPGVSNEDPDQNTEGMVVIEHSQRWQP
ncbi:MAG: hypothetical protein CL610_11575 [Anaerolineaceae bacterium]|nr:hypothetical protein [Anaerolineaceae bacterium]